MDRQYVVENDVVDRYLADKLSDEEREAFETHCLRCQETLDDLELTEKLREGLADAATAADRWQPRLVSRLLYSPQYAAAASVFLAVSLLAIGGLLYDRIGDQGGAEAALSSNQVFTLVTERVQAADPSSNLVYVDEASKMVVLIVYPAFGDYDRHRAAVHPIGVEESIWQDQNIRPGSDALAVILPSQTLMPGDYRLQVEGVGSNGVSVLLDDIPFRVAPQTQ